MLFLCIDNALTYVRREYDAACAADARLMLHDTAMELSPAHHESSRRKVWPLVRDAASDVGNVQATNEPPTPLDDIAVVPIESMKARASVARSPAFSSAMYAGSMRARFR